MGFLITLGTLALITLVIFIIIFLTHLRPLNVIEIRSLAVKRRNKEIKRYFVFDSRSYVINSDFKKKMNTIGKLYDINDSLYSFPSVAAGLLKYKKHEWILIAFEKSKIIEKIWTNKGFKYMIFPSLDIEGILRNAKRGNYETIMIFHNHPNSNPNYYSCKSPSDQDKVSANYYAEIFSKNNLNLLDFICERGKFYEYYRFICNNFFKVENLENQINVVNRISKAKNLKLHLERIF